MTRSFALRSGSFNLDVFRTRSAFWGSLMNARLRWLILFLACTAACKGKRADDQPHRPGRACSRGILLKEQARAEKGEPVGEGLRAPKIVVTNDQVTINGHPVATGSNAAGDGGASRASSVYEWTKGAS